MKTLSGCIETETKLNSESNVAVNSSASIDNIQARLLSAQKLLENKEAILRIQEESLKLNKARVIELSRCVDALQIDRDSKAQEVLNLQRAIGLHVNTINELQRERAEHWVDPIFDIEGSTDDEFVYHQLEAQREAYKTEINKYEDTVKSLKFDLNLMESLYKSCNEEMIKQEKQINLLRDAYFTHYFREFNLQLENKILESALEKKNKSLESCKGIFQELNNLKQEITLFINTGGTKKTKYEAEKVDLIINDIKNDFDEISSELYELQNVLISQSSKGKVDDGNDEIDINVNDAVKSKSLNKEIVYLKDKLNCSKKKLLSNKTSINILIKKLKISQGNLKQKKLQMLQLKTKCSQKDKRIDMMREKNSDRNTVHTKNIAVAEENHRLKNDLQVSKIQLHEYEEANLNLSLRLMSLQKKYSNLENVYEAKNDSINWLELELNEASTAGSQLCNESEQMFTDVRKWVYAVKEERRFLLAKLTEFEEHNQLLRV